jgi:sugar/nucleoside kinase (ribokinase family)
MTITVIGHLCMDENHFPDETGSPRDDHGTFGGIFHSIATLAHVMSSTDTIHPVLGVGDGEYDAFLKRLEAFPNVDSSGIFRFKGETNRVLVFHQKDNSHRIECSKHIAEPIPFNKIKPYLDADAILINMVSGADITLETLDRIRMAVRDSRTPIHFDFHSLTLGIDQDNRRFRRPLTDWRRWCFMVNSVQLSEEEAAGLTAERFDEHTLINHLMPLMVSALVITRGEKGVSAVLQENKKLTHHDFEGQLFGPTVDTAGCGDVFGAAFLCSYMNRKDYHVAAEYANRIAGLKATIPGIDGLGSALKDLEQFTAEV